MKVGCCLPAGQWCIYISRWLGTVGEHSAYLNVGAAPTHKISCKELLKLARPPPNAAAALLRWEQKQCWLSRVSFLSRGAEQKKLSTGQRTATVPSKKKVLVSFRGCVSGETLFFDCYPTFDRRIECVALGHANAVYTCACLLA